MAKINTFSLLEQWNFHKCSFNSKDNIPEKQLRITYSHIIFPCDNFLICKRLNASLLPEDKAVVQKLKGHSAPVLCFNIIEPESLKTLLIVSCSEKEVILWKWNLIGDMWDSYTIANEMGQAKSCSLVLKTPSSVIVSCAKSEEVNVIVCTSSIPYDGFGLLGISNLEEIVEIPKNREITNWLKTFFISGALFIIGVSTGNIVTIKMWEINAVKKTFKLLDCKTIFGGPKTFSGVDLKSFNNNEVMLLVLCQDGTSNIYSASIEGLKLISSLKINDNFLTNVKDDSYEEEIQMEFKILSGILIRFIDSLDHELSEPEDDIQCSQRTNEIDNDTNGILEASSDSFSTASEGYEREEILKTTEKNEFDTMNDAERIAFITKYPNPNVSLVLDISLDASFDNNNGDRPRKKWITEKQFENCPKLSPLKTRTFRKHCPRLIILVLTSKGFLFVDAKSGEIENSSTIEDICKYSPIIESAVLNYKEAENKILFAFQPFMQRQISVFNVILSLEETTFTDNFSIFGVEPILMQSILKKRLKSPAKKETPKRGRKQINKTTCSPFASSNKSEISSASSETNISRSTPITNKLNYDDQKELFTSGIENVLINERLSNGISNLIMASTRDGKYLCMAGNMSPVIIAKVRPAFHKAQSFKDLSNITSVNFSFNSKYLLMGNNEVKSTLYDWQKGVKLFNFDFTTRFKEHVDGRFYYVDNFIVQPEENRIAFYSFKMTEGEPPAVKIAGSFDLPCQAITALAASNQFFSNYIFCALTTRELTIFDVNCGKVSVSIPKAHSKVVGGIYLNEAPKASIGSFALSQFLVTTSQNYIDPIKLWDLRSARCVSRISDVNPSMFVANSKASLSPCGNYIATGYEGNNIAFYDVRKLNSRVRMVRAGNSNVLSCHFDPQIPIVYYGCRDGTIHAICS